MLEEGFHKVPLGHVATVVTYLEMTSPAALRPAELPEGVNHDAQHGVEDKHRHHLRSRHADPLRPVTDWHG